MSDKVFEQLYEATIKQVEAVIATAIECDVLNEQITLNFLDRLNELSVIN